jgi:hypothetical protein
MVIFWGLPQNKGNQKQNMCHLQQTGDLSGNISDYEWKYKYNMTLCILLSSSDLTAPYGTSPFSKSKSYSIICKQAISHSYVQVGGK